MLDPEACPWGESWGGGATVRVTVGGREPPKPREQQGTEVVSPSRGVISEWLTRAYRARWLFLA